MSSLVYRAEHTGLLLVDPYNDFLSHGGKIFPMIEAVANDVKLLDNLRAAVGAARESGEHCQRPGLGGSVQCRRDSGRAEQ